jgi:chromosome segregation ATPase
MESLVVEKDKLVEAESNASSALWELKEKYKRKKSRLHKVRKECAGLRREFDHVSASRASLVAKKADLEKKHQEVQQSLETIKSLHI